MASKNTVRKSMRIITRLTKIFGPEIHPPFAVMFDRQGKIITRWEGEGSLAKARKRGPGTMEEIYRELPRETLLKYIIFTETPAVKPTQKEWEEFERKLLTTARRVVIRQIRKRFKEPIERLPEPPKKKQGRGRPRLKEDRPKLVLQTVEQWLSSGECKTTTEAVAKAAQLFGDGKTPLHVDTVWRYLRHAGRVGPRSAKLSSK